MLGAMLLDPAAIMRILDFLNPQDFYRENHGQIYRAALSTGYGEQDTAAVCAVLEHMAGVKR